MFPEVGSSSELEVEIPQQKDWFAEGVVTIPSNQRACGSCWAFSTAASLEGLAVISKSFEGKADFSIQ